MLRVAFFVVVSIMCLPLLGADATQPADQSAINFDDISFEPPSKEWQATPEQIGAEYLWKGTPEQVHQILFTQKTGERWFIRLAVEAIIFPATLHGRSQHEIASSFFEIQKRVFAAELAGRDFVEGERGIAGRRYPTMNFRSAALHMDGLLVLYFPEGFDAKQKFYSFLWADSHPDNQRPSGLGTLDAIVSSVKVKP